MPSNLCGGPLLAVEARACPCQLAKPFPSSAKKALFSGDSLPKWHAEEIRTPARRFVLERPRAIEGSAELHAMAPTALPCAKLYFISRTRALK
jgi:hypothetical protein